jgi:hypothetical protein
MKYHRRNLFRMAVLGVGFLATKAAHAEWYGGRHYDGPLTPEKVYGEHQYFEDQPHHHHHHYRYDPSGPTPTGAAGGCWLKGTHIHTPWGWRYVESLRPGETITTIDATADIVAIDMHEVSEAVRIQRNALGMDIPDANLVVTGAHALWLDGALVPAGNLVNGRTIINVNGDFEVYDIKLKHHDIVIANNVPCESMLDIRTGGLSFAQAKLAWQRLQRRSLCASPA